MAGTTICGNCGKMYKDHTIEELAACRAAQN